MPFPSNFFSACRGLFSRQTALAEHGVNLGLARADMDGRGLCVHDGVVAGGYARHTVYRVPFAARWGWVEDVGPITHN